jgi:tetratricopeptide (TPR) repeat protein
LKRRTFYIFLSVAVLALLVQTAPAQSPTYLLDGKPVSAQVYQAGLLMNLGIELNNANRPMEAKQKMAEAVRIAPDFLDAHYNLGVVLMGLGEKALAGKHFDFVVVSRGNFPMAWLALGQIWLDQAKYHEAVNVFVDALKRYPEQTWRDRPEFYHNYGVALAKVGEMDKAVAQLKLALRIKGALPDSWLSLGTAYLATGRYQESVEVFAESLGRYPKQMWRDKPEFYVNYGFALAKVGEFDKSVEQMKIALDAKTDLPEAWAALGSLHQGSGRLEDAIASYREFIRRFPNRAEAIMIVDLIRALESEIKIAKFHGATASKESKDYYGVITRRGATRWPAKKMPLKVHIQSGDGIAGFKPRYAELLRTAFDEWSEASQGKVTFKFVDNGASADIRCSWTSEPSQLKNRAERGETQILYEQAGAVQRATVVILTVPTMGLSGVSDNQMRWISLHEVGHALGLIGHSPDPADIMFLGESMADLTRYLSERDRQTLIRLYALPNALPKTKPRPR